MKIKLELQKYKSAGALLLCNQPKQNSTKNTKVTTKLLLARSDRQTAALYVLAQVTGPNQRCVGLQARIHTLILRYYFVNGRYRCYIS